jgi:Protein of unknown function (DUF1360)
LLVSVRPHLHNREAPDHARDLERGSALTDRDFPSLPSTSVAKTPEGFVVCETAVKQAYDEPELQNLRWDKYGENQPLTEFSALVFIQSAVLLILATIARGRRYPRIRLGDLILLGVGTHKLSRLVAKDRVTSPLRAPFTRYEKSAGSGEVEEEPRGKGFQAVVGELLSCPYCMSVWVASGLLSLFLIDRKLARLLCKWLAMVTRFGCDRHRASRH